jgi:EthD domain
MIKVLWLLKRKSGITPQQFRERYERHARLGRKLAGHLIARYKRNYKTEAWGGGTPTTHDGSTQFRPIQWEYDCVSEVSFASLADYEANKKIFAEPEIARQFYEDEEDFLDRKSVIMLKCDEVDTGSNREGN